MFRIIRLIILFIVLYGIMFGIVLCQKATKDNNNQDNAVAFQESSDDENIDQFYYYSLAYEMISEVQEGMSQQEVLQNLIDLGFNETDINKMIIELGVDWNNLTFTNTDSYYYKELYLDGTIISNDLYENDADTSLNYEN